MWPIVQLGNTVTHVIDEESPLYDFSVDELLSGHHFFVVLFTGLDSVVGETMFARKTYHSCDMLVGHHFVDNIKLAADGLHIDLDAINETKFTPDIDLRESRLFVQHEGSPESPHHEDPESNFEKDKRTSPVDPDFPASPRSNFASMRE